MFSFPWSIYQAEELLRHMVILPLAFSETMKHFPKCSMTLHFYQKCIRGPCFHILYSMHHWFFLAWEGGDMNQHLYGLLASQVVALSATPQHQPLSLSFIIGIQYLSVILIFIILMISIEHLFIHFLIICVFLCRNSYSNVLSIFLKRLCI